MNFKRLEALREAGHVKRLHAVPTLYNHTIAEHVYGAQCIAMELMYALPAARMEVVLYALLVHDAPEVWTGDVPAHMKKRHPTMSQDLELEEVEWRISNSVLMPDMNKWERLVVQAADRLDLAMHLLYERQMGCRHPRHTEVFNRVLDYVVQECGELKGVPELVDYLKGEWR